MVISLSLLPNAANAQKLQTYQGERVYSTLYELKVAGTEKFSYSVSERGERLIQGSYSFSGSNEISNSTNQFIIIINNK